MKFFGYFVFLVSFAFLATTSMVFSQKGDDNKRVELSTEEMEKIQTFLSDYDKKIETALMSDKKNYLSMKEDIDKISELKDIKVKSEAISAYQKKYMNVYNSALKKANVNLNDAVKKLKSILPGFDINLINNAIYFKSSKSANLSLNSGGSKPVTVRLREFEEKRTVSCGLGAGGDVKHTSNSLEVTSVSAVAGGCLNTGSKNIEYKVPKDVKSAVLKLKARASISGFAVGVVGFALTQNYSDIYINGGSVAYVYAMTFAPFLWVGNNSDEETCNFEREYRPNDEIELDFNSTTRSVSAVCCGTNGKASITEIDAKVELKR